MTEDDESGTEPQGTSHAQQPPGGGSSRGPDFGTGGEPQVPVPPYDDVRGKGAAAGAEGVRKAFDASQAPEPGSPPVVSAEERDGVSGTEIEPGPALGVGESSSAGAEEQAPGRGDVEAQGAAQRPAGKVADDDNADEAGPAGPK
jgi:hypothetical protein